MKFRGGAFHYTGYTISQTNNKNDYFTMKFNPSIIINTGIGPNVLPIVGIVVVLKRLEKLSEKKINDLCSPLCMYTSAEQN